MTNFSSITCFTSSANFIILAASFRKLILQITEAVQGSQAGPVDAQYLIVDLKGSTPTITNT